MKGDSVVVDDVVNRVVADGPVPDFADSGTDDGDPAVRAIGDNTVLDEIGVQMFQENPVVAHVLDITIGYYDMVAVHSQESDAGDSGFEPEVLYGDIPQIRLGAHDFVQQGPEAGAVGPEYEVVSRRSAGRYEEFSLSLERLPPLEQDVIPGSEKRHRAVDLVHGFPGS